MCISAYLKDKGYDVSCLNLNHYDSSKLADVLRKNHFDIVATGEMFTRFKLIRAIIETTREYSPSSKIVLGGAIATGDPEFILNELLPDYLVLGEGEVTMELLVQAIKNNSDIHGVTGIAFKENGTIVNTKPTPLIEDLDELPYPDYEGFEYGYYMNNFIPKKQHLQAIMDTSKRRLANVMASRDCMMKCTFCFRIMGGGYRTRSIKKFFGEISYLIDKYSINELFMQDDILAPDKKRILEFCKTIKSMNLPWSCYLRVTKSDKDIIDIMKDAGCYEITYGLESASPVVLKSMRKGITPKLMKKAIELTTIAKINIPGNFIFGDLAENLNTMDETLRFLRKFAPAFTGLKLISPYPGTVLYEKYKIKYGTKNLISYYLNPLIRANITSLSEMDYTYMAQKINFEHYYHRLRSKGKILNSKKIAPQTHELDVRCPHCEGENINCKIDFNEGYQLICKYCFQTFFINKANFRFGNISQMYQFCYLYIKKLVLHNVYIYRLLFFIPPLIEKTACIFRAVVNLSKKNYISLKKPLDIKSEALR